MRIVSVLRAQLLAYPNLILAPAATPRMNPTGLYDFDRATGSMRWTPGMYELLDCPVDTVPTTALWEQSLHPDDKVSICLQEIVNRVCRCCAVRLKCHLHVLLTSACVHTGAHESTRSSFQTRPQAKRQPIQDRTVSSVMNSVRCSAPLISVYVY